MASQISVASSAMLVASERADKEHGLGIDDIDLFEVNDALASVVLAWAKENGADLGRTNVTILERLG
ncbi:MAG: hypothetical protein ACXWXO_09185 [Nocardioides sp.]